MRIFWAVIPLAFLLGCFAHSLTQEAAAASHAPDECASREDVEYLRVRIVVLEERLQTHAAAIRAFQQSLGIGHDQ